MKKISFSFLLISMLSLLLINPGVGLAQTYFNNITVTNPDNQLVAPLWISNVTAGSINNSSSLSDGFNQEHVYPRVGTLQIKQGQNNVPVYVKTKCAVWGEIGGWSKGLEIFIDYDNDGKFEFEELVGSNSMSGTFYGWGNVYPGAERTWGFKFNVPLTAKTGFTTMRVQISSEAYKIVDGVPCGTGYWAGECEDYSVKILNAFPKLGELEDSEFPNEFSLDQNYPNPFNPFTTIQYRLQENSLVNLVVYDLLGREVQTLVNQYETAGTKSAVWNGKNNAGESVASGTYIYTIKAGTFTQTRAMVLLK